jgi:hypothetical protein
MTLARKLLACSFASAGLAGPISIDTMHPSIVNSPFSTWERLLSLGF